MNKIIMKENDWEKLGFGKLKMKFWFDHYFEPIEALSWIILGFDDADEAKRWREAGFDPLQALEEIEDGKTIDDIIEEGADIIKTFRPILNKSKKENII